MLQLGQDMALCETQATESHSGNTKLDKNYNFKRATSLFPRQIFSLHKTEFLVSEINFRGYKCTTFQLQEQDK